MSTGFETMVSAYTSLLHPPVDPSDAYDPTFLGVKRKRRLAEPVHENAVFRDAGKHIDRSKMKHTAECFHQHDQMFVPETFAGDTQSTRFGVGFTRRHASTIGVDALRELDEDRRQERATRLLEARRSKNEQNRSTGLAHIFGGTAPATADRPTRELPQSKQAALSNRTSSIFRAPDVKATVYAVARRERLIHEGLTDTKKDWSVKQQLSALDGYTLPAIRR